LRQRNSSDTSSSHETAEELSLHRAEGRLDHQFNPNNKAFFRYSIDKSLITMPDIFDRAIGGNQDNFTGDNTVTGCNLVGAFTWVISPLTVGDFRYGYTQFNSALIPTQLSNPLWRRIPGRDASDPLQPTAPNVGTSGYAGLGDARSTPLIRDQKMLETIAKISTLKGEHNIKYGFDLRMRTTGETVSLPGEIAFGRWNFDPAAAQQLIVNVNGVSRTGNINADLKAWGPRVSFAYQLDKRTALRDGYGLFYEPQGNSNTRIWQFRQPLPGRVLGRTPSAA
jgi:hypothetical protein